MTDDLFEETTDVPAGRKARELSAALREKLEDSAKRGVAFSKTGPKELIDELRKDLNSASVKPEFDVTTATAKLPNGHHKLTFAAKRKPNPVKAGEIKPQQKEAKK